MMLQSDPIAIVAEAPSLAQEIAELRALKASMDASRRAFFVRLREVQERGGWRSLAPTFDLFLMKVDLCRPKEYREACMALDLIPADTIDAIGIAAASKALHVPEMERPAALADLTRAAEKTGPLSDIKANSVIRRHMPPPPPTARRASPPSTALPPSPPMAPPDFTLRVSSREPSAIAAALVARLGDDECRALILALDAKVNRVRVAG